MELKALPTPDAWCLGHLATCDSSVRLRRLVEWSLVASLVDRLLAAGLQVSVDSGGDELDLKNSTDRQAIIEAVFAVDGCFLFAHPGLGAVQVVLGNGPDLFVDWSDLLDHIVEPLEDGECEAYRAWF